MRIAVIAAISGVLCGWSLQAPANSDVVASPKAAANAPASASPAADNAPAAPGADASADARSVASDAAGAAQTVEQKAAQETADIALFKSLGFYKRIVKGETRFCKTEYISGSRLESVTTCRSAEQIRATLPAQK